MKNILLILSIFIYGCSSAQNNDVWRALIYQGGCVTPIFTADNATPLRNKFLVSCSDTSVWFVDINGKGLKVSVGGSGSGGSVITDGVTISGDGTTLNPLTLQSVPLNLLDQTGAATGQVLTWNGTTFSPQTPSVSGSWNVVSTNAVSQSVNDVIYHYNQTSVGERAVFGTAEFSVLDSTPAGRSAVVVSGDRDAITSYNRYNDGVWTSFGMQGNRAVVSLPSGNAFFAVAPATGTPDAPINGTPVFEMHRDGNIKVPFLASADLLGTDGDGFLTEVTNVSPAQFSQDGATTGQVITWNGSGWSPADIPASETLANTGLYVNSDTVKIGVPYTPDSTINTASIQGFRIVPFLDYNTDSYGVDIYNDDDNSGYAKATYVANDTTNLRDIIEQGGATTAGSYSVDWISVGGKGGYSVSASGPLTSNSSNELLSPSSFNMRNIRTASSVTRYSQILLQDTFLNVTSYKNNGSVTNTISVTPHKSTASKKIEYTFSPTFTSGNELITKTYADAVPVVSSSSFTGNGITGSPLTIANNGISTAMLQDDAVTASKLADNSVFANNINNGATTYGGEIYSDGTSFIFGQKRRQNYSATNFAGGSSGTFSLGTANVDNLLYNGAATITALTVNVPASPSDGQITSFTIHGSGVTTLTIANGTIVGSYPTTTTNGFHAELKYYSTVSAWVVTYKNQ